MRNIGNRNHHGTSGWLVVVVVVVVVVLEDHHQQGTFRNRTITIIAALRSRGWVGLAK